MSSLIKIILNTEQKIKTYITQKSHAYIIRVLIKRKKRYLKNNKLLNQIQHDIDRDKKIEPIQIINALQNTYRQNIGLFKTRYSIVILIIDYLLYMLLSSSNNLFLVLLGNFVTIPIFSFFLFKLIMLITSDSYYINQVSVPKRIYKKEITIILKKIGVTNKKERMKLLGILETYQNRMNNISQQRKAKAYQNIINTFLTITTGIFSFTAVYANKENRHWINHIIQQIITHILAISKKTYPLLLSLTIFGLYFFYVVLKGGEKYIVFTKKRKTRYAIEQLYDLNLIEIQLHPKKND
ncbi:unnamed protein product [Fructobacillus tropaeoli]|uniref:hypothetical protein n=1 Tax=Fructobacillus tropaeoli TaxID=709323 RepID=UPI002D957B1F|nr:unnamed protein product [Fructobacillus tropaeoli]